MMNSLKICLALACYFQVATSASLPERHVRQTGGPVPSPSPSPSPSPPPLPPPPPSHITASDMFCGVWEQKIGPSGAVSPIENFEINDEIPFTIPSGAPSIQVKTQAFFTGVHKDSLNNEYPVRVSVSADESYSRGVAYGGSTPLECLHASIAVDIKGTGALGVIYGRFCKEELEDPTGTVTLIIVDDNEHGKEVHRYTYNRTSSTTCGTDSFDNIHQLYSFNQNPITTDDPYDWEQDLGIPNGPTSTDGGFHSFATHDFDGFSFLYDCVGVYRDFDATVGADQTIKVALACGVSIPDTGISPESNEALAWVGTLKFGATDNDIEHLFSFMTDDLPETFVLDFYLGIHNKTTP